MFERFSSAARSAVVVAQEQARELRSPTVGPAYLLLGITLCAEADLRKVLADNAVAPEPLRDALRQRRGDEPLGQLDAEALRAIGIDLDSVRERLEATFGEDALERAACTERKSRGHRWPIGSSDSWRKPLTREAKKALELSLREAIARREGRIETAHVLLGVISAADATTQALLGGEEGIVALRLAVNGLLDRAA